MNHKTYCHYVFSSVRDKKITSYPHVVKALLNQVFSLSHSWSLYFNHSLLRNQRHKNNHPLMGGYFLPFGLGGPSGTRTPDLPVMSRLL